MSADTPMRKLLPLALLPIALGACEWFTDFKQQPSLHPWTATTDSTPPRGEPQSSVPITGTAVAAYQVSYKALPNVIDSIAAVVGPNPTAPSASSLANGKKYYQINCSVCHGMAGKGDGPATKYGMAGINLTMDVTKNRPDGYIFGMIRNGRGLMPTYDRIEEMDRWDVVNYVRSLQGRLGQPADTTLAGRPGETGEHVPGYTRIGPTRPAPYLHPRDAGLLPRIAGVNTTPTELRHGGTVAAESGGPALPDTTSRTAARHDSTVHGASTPGARPKEATP